MDRKILKPVRETRDDDTFVRKKAPNYRNNACRGADIPFTCRMELYLSTILPWNIRTRDLGFSSESKLFYPRESVFFSLFFFPEDKRERS